MALDYEVIIAGAGPAGCAAAYDLARAGRRVLLLDKRNFPRPKACACGLTRKTLKALRYSVEPVIERVCCDIVLQQSAADPEQREVRVHRRKPICAMAVREHFDAFCLEQTLASGPHIELRKIETIVSLREAAGCVEIEIATSAGVETLRAAVLVGADGSNGQTRRLVGGAAERTAEGTMEGAAAAVAREPAWYQRGFALEATVDYSALPVRLPGGGAAHDLVFDFTPLAGGYGWLFPKGDHINIGVGAFAPGDAGADARLQQVTRQLLLDYTRQRLGEVALAHITGQHLGMGGQNYEPRGRVLLAGDAAGLVDPLTGEGLHSAIVSGQAAAAAILSNAPDVAAEYARRLAPLQQTLAFSHRAARAFYADTERGFRAMRLPPLGSLILKTYADGLPHARLLTALAKLV